MDTSLILRTARLALVLCATVAAALALRASPAGAAIVQVQQGAFASATSGSVTPTLPSASTAGTLLVAVMGNGTNTAAFSAPAGWTQAVTANNACCGRVDIWYYANNPGGITSASFTAASGSTQIWAQLSEWNGLASASPVDKTGTKNQGSAASATVSTSASTTVANELGITAFNTSGTNVTSLGAGSGWTHLFTDLAGANAADYKLNLPVATQSETETVSPNTSWEAVIATFKPATCSSGSLSLSAPGSTSFNGVTLNGTDQTATATVTLKPDDETAAHTGWNVTETSTTFNDGSGHTLPTTATVTTAASAAAAGGNCVLPTNSVTYPVILPAGTTAPTAVKAYNAAASTGQGPANVTLGYQLSVPANTFRGTYTSTWTFAIVSGP
jgi:hypothetical protein